MSKIQVVRVFVASPSNLVEERQTINEVIHELNRSWGNFLGMSLEFVGWETHTFPGVSTDAQQLINDEINDDYHILIGMLWTRLGTPTPRSISGTVEEFERAYHRWKINPYSVHIMFYFKNTPISPEDIDPDELRQIFDFKKRIQDLGVYYSKFSTEDEFSQQIRVHLSLQLQKLKGLWSNNESE